MKKEEKRKDDEIVSGPQKYIYIVKMGSVFRPAWARVQLKIDSVMGCRKHHNKIKTN